MKKVKLEKGITLIALIISIVVLLILAVVTIGAVQESGIIGHAQKAGSDYRTKADEEDTILDGYIATIEDNIPGAGNGSGNGENDDSTEEIVWSYIDYGDDYYNLRYIGNATELELIEDKDLKVYPGTFNEDSEEYEYDNTQTISIKLSEVERVDIGPFVEKVTVGQVARNFRISYPENEITLVVLAEFGDIPESHFDENNIKSIVIQEGIESIGNGAFAENNIISLTLPASVTSIGAQAFTNWELPATNNKLYYNGTKEQWNVISSAFPRGYNIKVIFNDGTEIVI